MEFQDVPGRLPVALVQRRDLGLNLGQQAVQQALKVGRCDGHGGRQKVRIFFEAPGSQAAQAYHRKADEGVERLQVR
ncbi:hypothetical protein D3C86_1960620 [compost metagenome]